MARVKFLPDGADNMKMKPIFRLQIINLTVVVGLIVLIAFPGTVIAQSGSSASGFGIQDSSKGGLSTNTAGCVPVPEVGVSILVVAGLVGLGVFRYVRRRKSRE
jgi:hypothetical protein